MEEGIYALLSPGHGAALSHLHAQCFPTSWSADAFEALLAKDTLFASGMWIGSTLEAALLVQCAPGSADVILVMTSPAARRQGFSKTLMCFFLQDFLEAPDTACFLEVAQDNVAALELYKSLNFKICGERKGYYDTPHTCQDAWVLRAP